MNDKNYEYIEVQKYKESIELSQLKKSTILVNIAILLVFIPLIYLLIRLNISVNEFVRYISPLFILLIINYFFVSYEDNQYNYLSLLMYGNTFFILIYCINLIYQFQTPSIFVSLFLAYGITTLYQDFKVMLVSDIAIFTSGVLFVYQYSDMFNFNNSGMTQIYFIFVFVFIFALILTISFYIFIQRKEFFYNNIADIKEYEYRNLDMMVDLQRECQSTKLNISKYYKSVLMFINDLKMNNESKQEIIEMVNILKDINNDLTVTEILSKYPKFNIEEIRNLKKIRLDEKNKIRKMAIKASQSINVYDFGKRSVNKNEYKTLNHISDSLEVKIIAFSVFYTMLKMDKPYLRTLTEKEIYDFLSKSKYYYYINPKVLNVYFDNNLVFDTIVSDNLHKEDE